MDIEGCRWRSKWCRPMHLVSLESLGFRNLNVSRYTTHYIGNCCSRCITYTDRKTNIWVREKARTLLNKSEDGSGPGKLECDVVQCVS